ncbi:MAG TPA: NADH-quinone oxidoreductase subunit NuoG [Burkholderiales bacterium]|nr:NADH-quinone oxidoreductase subunit NuoG [Burkholderiales bacterium]
MSQNLINIEIDGRKVAVPGGSMVMHAANQLGIYVPHFCYHKKLSIAANCRMCLVQVEKAPKPLPACATPVTEGMKVWTRSELAVNAQKAVMEFLLINHPLDCPICDQGGECQLQDLAVGYGGGSSRYGEEKRVVTNKDLGPLISTDMTRCIHCTRCVRFGQEVADVMELGMANRGEHSEIMTFVGRSVDSELSGNAIDLCPVGALTSKPFRFSARTWELARRRSVSPHCGLGSNLVVQVKLDRVLRVLPRENEDLNECWLSDKDRFSYEGLNTPDRLRRPMVRREGRWQECDWSEALEAVAAGLAGVKQRHGAAQIGALASPHSTLEELYLLQKLMRGLGSGNVDFRLRQTDFLADAEMKGVPWLGMKVAELDKLQGALVVGSNLRKDHPLLAHRLRQAVKAGASLSIINPLDDDLLTRVANKIIVGPADLPAALAQVVKAAAEAKGAQVPAAVAGALAGVSVSDTARAIAHSLTAGRAAVLLGNLAQHHPAARDLQALGQHLAALTGATFGFLGEAANSVGGYIAGAVPRPPHADAIAGMDAAAMLSQPLKAYVVLGAEPELDCGDSRRALAAMQGAGFVVALSPWRHLAADYADVLLPVAPFTETAGTFINTEGRVQSFNAVVHPYAEARPAWKVLRVLGNLLGIGGFDFDTPEGVRAAMGIEDGAELSARLDNTLGQAAVERLPPTVSGLQRIGDVPIYSADPLVRRAESLSRTRDGAAPAAAMNGALMQRLGVKEGEAVAVSQGDGGAVLPVRRDDGLPQGCVRVPAGHPATAGLGAMFGEIEVRRAEVEQRMAG